MDKNKQKNIRDWCLIFGATCGIVVAVALLADAVFKRVFPPEDMKPKITNVQKQR
ncbi:MAG: hypothetical protein J6S06_04110 [Alphaproteobacteria bacterium]|nr:hypothetical protein [Alphaproteobacteria bacterium]MBR5575210.1 hypothetical protein [Alphaproteobacteria bacterium]